MKPFVILRVVDGLPGHEAQSEGLVKALVRFGDSTIFDVPALTVSQALISLVADRGFDTVSLPHPELVICCGHKTHLSGIALRKRLGGRLVVLMTPSLPNCLFDMVVSPTHDGLREGPTVLLSEGVLNALDSEGSHDSKRGLFLIGGPSRHHGWHESELIEQICAIATSDPAMCWTVSTSRRTPATTTEAISELKVPNLNVVPFERTALGWVAHELASCSIAWITEDSVSMVYEALTAGVAVGLLKVPRIGHSRVSEGVKVLIAEGRATPYSQWLEKSKVSTSTPLAEANRVAHEIMERWYPERLKKLQTP